MKSLKIAEIKKISKFYISDLIHSKIVVIAAIVFLFAPVPIVIGFHLINASIYYVSFLITMCFSGIILIFSFLLTNKLFSENKTNFSDVSLITRNYSRKTILGIKLSISFLLLVILNAEMMLVSAIVLYSYRVDVVMVNALCVANFIGLLINSFAILPILILLSIYFKQIWFSICSFFIIFGLLFSSFGGNYMLTDTNQNNNLVAKADQNTKNTYVNLEKINTNGQLVGSEIAVNTNYLNANPSINTNDNYENNINNVNYANNFLPGQLFNSPQSGIFSAILGNNSLNYLSNNKDYKGSLLRYTGYDKQNLSNFINNNGQYVYVPMPLFAKSPFALSSFGLREELKTALNEIISKSNSSSFNLIDLSNSADVTKLLKILEKNINWSSLTTNLALMNTIAQLVGIGSNPILYYLWNYNYLLKSNLGNVSQFVSSNFSPELWNLLNYIWTNNNTFINIYIENVNNFGTSLNNLYPNNLSINYKSTASPKDINFIQNSLINFNNGVPFLLLNNGTYIALSSATTAGSVSQISQFESFINFKTNSDQNLETSWNTYLQSNLTYQQLATLYQNIESLNPNAMPYFINQNYLSPNSYNYIFAIKAQPFVDKVYIPVIFELLIGLVVLVLLFPLYERKDYNV